MNVTTLEAQASAAPWTVCEDEEFGLHITDGCGIIAKIGPCGEPGEEDRANARLIVHFRNHFMEALAALKVEAHDCHAEDQSCKYCDRVRKLIAKLERIKPETVR